MDVIWGAKYRFPDFKNVYTYRSEICGALQFWKFFLTWPASTINFLWLGRGANRKWRSSSNFWLDRKEGVHLRALRITWIWWIDSKHVFEATWWCRHRSGNIEIPTPPPYFYLFIYFSFPMRCTLKHSNHIRSSKFLTGLLFLLLTQVLWLKTPCRKLKKHRATCKLTTTLANGQRSTAALSPRGSSISWTESVLGSSWTLRTTTSSKPPRSGSFLPRVISHLSNPTKILPYTTILLPPKLSPAITGCRIKTSRTREWASQ